MKCEIPHVTRCCFFIPLRKGILAWAYIKLGLLFLGGTFVMFVTSMALMFGASIRRHPEEFLPILLSFVYYIVEMVFTNLLIVGAHMKKFKLLRIYFIYSIVNIMILTGLFFGCILIPLAIHVVSEHSVSSGGVFKVMGASFIYLALNIYMLILVRSEYRKLQDDKLSFEFVNNAADAECTMKNPKVDVK